MFRQSLLNLTYGRPRVPTAPFDPSQVRKILLIRRNGIGDMICTLPLIRNIKAAWPNVQLNVLASEKNAVLLEGCNEVSRVFLYTRGTGIFRNHYFNLPNIVRPLRAQHYDLVIAVKGGFSPLLATITYATQIPWRLGYVPSRGHPLDFCFNLKIELPREREHQVESCLRFLDPLKISKTSCDLSFPLQRKHQDFAKETLSKNSLSSRKFALMNISSERYESRWTSEAMVQTAQELEKQFQLKTLVCGLSRDRALLEEVAQRGKGAVVGFAEPPSIHDFAALVQHSRFLLCGDGGPMHVAAAMKTPAFVLFSATDPRIWRPYEVPFAFVQKGRLVSEITSAEVIEKLKSWLPTLH
jgi:heptosyltransferase III